MRYVEDILVSGLQHDFKSLLPFQNFRLVQGALHAAFKAGGHEEIGSSPAGHGTSALLSDFSFGSRELPRSSLEVDPPI